MMRKKLYFFGLIPLVLSLSGCFYADDIRVSRASETEAREYYGISGSTSEGLSFDSRNYLQSNLMMSLYKENPEELIRILTEEFNKTKSRDILGTKADVCYNYAVEARDPNLANRYYLTAASTYYAMLFDKSLNQQGQTGRFDPAVMRSSIRYNAAVGQVFKYLKERGLLRKKAFHFPSADGEIIEFPNYPDFKLAKVKEGYEDFLLCSDYKTEKLAHFSYHFGIGTPLIALTRDASGTDSVLKLARDLALPATCILRFGPSKDGIRAANLEFYDSEKYGQITISGETVPLTQDFSTPAAYFVNYRERVNLLSYMLNPNQDNHSGLYAMSPYDPEKIPVVFVHGLMSSPQTWVQLTNTLSSDPVIQKNYQFWFYTYSSGNPILFTAQKLRNAVDAIREKHGKDPHFSRMVIVGHSMGGLLAKTFILSTEESMLTKQLGRPWSEAKKDLTPEEIKIVEDAVFFKQRDYVSRIVFLAVPHKGSEMANWSIARLGTALISLPAKLVYDVSALTEKLIPGATEENKNKKYLYTGIDNLSPDNPVLTGLSSTPFPKNVKFHSIIGNQVRAGVPGGTDGVVKYESSHLDNVESELVVKSGHSVQSNPETIRELGRILRLHLEELKANVGNNSKK